MEIKHIKDISIRHFGFSSRRPSRMREYSWILSELDGFEGYVCDIGAGTSPVPIMLADRCWVDTVDYWAESTGNEWGFVDYGKIDEHIRSFNCDFADFEPSRIYGRIYSISAIEHTPADTRRRIFKRAAELLINEGLLLITMDLTKGTTDIHNRNYNKVIEDNHGTVMDVIAEVEGHFSSVSWWIESFKGQGQDVLFIKAIK